jgi:hypothetical protein
MRRTISTAAISAGVTLLAVWSFGSQSLSSSVKLENERVRVVEVTSPPAAARERHVRAHDQVIVFLDDSRYERTDPRSGEKTIRTRKPGDVIWHSKGEDAPRLVNVGSKPYRTLVVELK